MSEVVSLSCPVCGRAQTNGSPHHATWCPDCGELMEPVDGPYRDGKVWVLSRKCDTCIFRPGNKMHLREGRVAGMIAACIEENTVIPCHQTLDGARSVCRGLYDLHKSDIMVIRLAHAFDMIAFDDPPEEHA